MFSWFEFKVDHKFNSKLNDCVVVCDFESIKDQEDEERKKVKSQLCDSYDGFVRSDDDGPKRPLQEQFEFERDAHKFGAAPPIRRTERADAGVRPGVGWCVPSFQLGHNLQPNFFPRLKGMNECIDSLTSGVD